MKYGLGRIAVNNPAAFASPMRPRKTALTRKVWAAGNPDAFDQRSLPQCVAFAAMRLLVASPIRNRMPESFDDFYAACQKIDGIRGPHDGSTVDAAMRVLESLGYVRGARWGHTVGTLSNQILTAGPVDAGTDWTADMFEPFKTGKWRGFIQVGKDYQVEGGHSYLLNGADCNKRCPDGSVGAFQIANSWGGGWGSKGCAWISFRDYALLLNNRGEAACADEVLVKARKAA